MHLSINIIGDAFADIYCYLEGSIPKHGGDARLIQPMHTVAGGSGLNTATHISSLLRNFWNVAQSNSEEEGAPHNTSNVNLQTVINENDEYGKLIASHCKRVDHSFTLINRRVSSCAGCFFGTNEAVNQRQADEKSTGHCAVIVSQGDRSFMTHLGCMADFRGSHILTNFLDPRDNKQLDVISTLQHVHIAGYYNIEGFWNGELASKLSEMRDMQTRTKQRMTVSLVVQHDATEKWDGGLLNLLQYVDFLILSEVEAKSIAKYKCGDKKASDNNEALFFQHIALFFKKYRTYIIVTMGSKGAVALFNGTTIHLQRTTPEIANPADPTGAGDAFAAGFIHGYLKHQTESTGNSDGSSAITMEALKNGMQWACAVATCSVTVQGASVPVKKETIIRMLKGIVQQ